MKRDGMVFRMPDRVYHRGPELSVTGAKMIRTCPAMYHWHRLHPAATKPAFDLGGTVHRLVLGEGDRVHVVDAYAWRTNAARDARDAAHAAGIRAVHRGEFLQAQRVAKAARQHPDVADIFDRPGKAEVSLFGDDPVTGVRLRARLDRLVETSDGVPVVVDVKTINGTDTHPRRLSRVVADFGYHMQAAWYVDLVSQVLGVPDVEFRFVFVPTGDDGPREPRVVTLTDNAVERGRELNRNAIDTFIRCTKDKRWPCSHDTFISVDLPRWSYQEDENL